MRDAIAERLQAAGLQAALAARLGAYGEALALANERANLTAARTPGALTEHLLDALSLVPFVDGPLVDVGSGGGLPGIPLALATGVEVVLVEAIAKKAAALQGFLAELGLSGRVVADRAERAAHDPELRERFRTATARAVAAAPVVAELTLPFLAVGGRALLQRGGVNDAERRALEDATLVLGGRVEEERPAGGERRILIVRKEYPTQARFPRRVGVPTKRPPCFT